MFTLSNQAFCLVCKEIANPRFGVQVSDQTTETGVNGSLCNHCYDSFLSSGHNSGAFRIAKLKTWLRSWQKDAFRNL